MPLRSILDVEIGPGWEQFLKEFQKHQEDLKRLPKEWQEIGRAALNPRTGLPSGSARRDVFGRVTDFFGTPLAGETAKKFKDAVEGVDRAMLGVARNTKDVAAHIRDATKDLLKWSAIVGAVGGLVGAGGGLWGIDRLAASASAGRRGAQGLGITTAEQTAFGVDYGRLVDANSLLGNVASAQLDLQNWQFRSLGIDPRSKNAAQISQEVVQKAHDLWARGDHSLQTMHAVGLDRFISPEEWRRIGGTPQKDLNEFAKQYGGDRRSLFITDADLKAWQDFKRQMSDAGAQIEATFIRGLEPLVPGLTNLSKAVSDALGAFLSKPELKQWIGEAGDAIERFAKYIGSDKFDKDVDDFVDGVGRLARGVGDALKWLGIIPSGPFEGAVAAGTAGRPRGNWLGPRGLGMMGGVPDPDATYKGNPAGAKQVVGFFEGKGWSHEQASGIAANLFAESGFDPKVSGDSGQAYGLGQWHPERQARFAALFGHDIRKSTLQEQLEFFEWELEHTESEAARRLRQAKTAREAAGIVSTYDERPRDKAGAAAYRGGIAAGISSATRVHVQIDNNTGGSAVVSASQLVQ